MPGASRRHWTLIALRKSVRNSNPAWKNLSINSDGSSAAISASGRRSSADAQIWDRWAESGEDREHLHLSPPQALHRCLTTPTATVTIALAGGTVSA